MIGVPPLRRCIFLVVTCSSHTPTLFPMLRILVLFVMWGMEFGTYFSYPYESFKKAYPELALEIQRLAIPISRVRQVTASGKVRDENAV